MLKAILFDLDDTLLDWSGRSLEWGDYERRHLAHVVTHIQEKGYTIGDPEAFYITVRTMVTSMWQEATDSLIAPSFSETIAQSLRAIGVPAELVDAEEVIHAFRWELVDGVTPFPDALEVLPELARHGLLLGIITNAATPMRLRDRELISSGLLDHFCEVRISAVDVGVLKPHPQIFTHALNWLGLTAEEVVFVGDNPVADVTGAQGVGMRAVLRDLRRPEQLADVEVAPDGTIYTLHDLLPLLDTWHPGWRS